jgi:hypothetical protein
MMQKQSLNASFKLSECNCNNADSMQVLRITGIEHRHGPSIMDQFSSAYFKASCVKVARAQVRALIL